MGLTILAIGIVVLWLWVRGRSLGAVGTFLALIFIFGPSAQPSWSWSDPDDEGLIALFAGIALLPLAVRFGAWRLSVYLNSPAAARRLIDRSLGRAPDRTFKDPNRSPNLLAGVAIIIALASILVVGKLHGQY